MRSHAEAQQDAAGSYLLGLMLIAPLPLGVSFFFCESKEKKRKKKSCEHLVSRSVPVQWSH